VGKITESRISLIMRASKRWARGSIDLSEEERMKKLLYPLGGKRGRNKPYECSYSRDGQQEKKLRTQFAKREKGLFSRLVGTESGRRTGQRVPASPVAPKRPQKRKINPVSPGLYPQQKGREA